jgi:extradiol dioxygenase family protein
MRWLPAHAEPLIQGMACEPTTMSYADRSGNTLGFKAFAGMGQIFAK